MKKASVLTTMLLFVFCLFVQSTDAQTLQFKDVKKSNSHYDGIYYLTDKGIINGYGDNTFKPENSITRSQTAVLFTRAMDLPIPSNVSSILRNYSDITVKHDYANEIAATYSAGIFTGSNGRFNDGSLTREQMASVLVRAYGLKDNGKKVNANLSNIDPSHRNNVKILVQHGITNQTGDFRPRSKVTRGQFATFLYRAMNSQDSTEKDKVEELPKEEEKPKEDSTSDTIVVHNERELADALSASSSYKVVELGKDIFLTDTLIVKNKGVLLKGTHGDMIYSVTGAKGKTVFEVAEDDVHFDYLRIYPDNSVGIHVTFGEPFQFTNGMIYADDSLSSGIIVEDNFKPIDDKGNWTYNDTAVIKDSLIFVPDIGVSFVGGRLILEDNLIDSAKIGLKFTAVETPKSIKENIFFMNQIDIATDYLPSFEKFFHLNHFDYGYPKVLELN